jgi:two-component system nitrate/nitrite response regulator NarL
MESDCGPLLVADDDDDFRCLLATLLERAGYRTVQAADGYAALAVARDERPEVVLLDVRLPGLGGYEVCRRLRDEFGEQLPIVFVSGARTEAGDRAAGLLIGADDYVVKPFDPDELLARVRRLIVRAGAALPREVAVPAALSSLTTRERQVLRLLADGLDGSTIATELFLSPKTVATHIQRILAKLGVHSRAQAVALALRTGVADTAPLPGMHG